MGRGLLTDSDVEVARTSTSILIRFKRLSRYGPNFCMFNGKQGRRHGLFRESHTPERSGAHSRR